MAYGEAFADVYDDVRDHLKAALDRLVTGTWSATPGERQLSGTRFAELKARRITATRKAEDLVAQAITALDRVSP